MSLHSHYVLQVFRECLVLTSCPYTLSLCCRSSGNVWCWHHVLTLSLCAAGIQGISGADIMSLHSHYVLQVFRECLVLTSCPYTISLCCRSSGNVWCWHHVLTLSLCAAGIQGMSGADSMFLTLSLRAAGLQGMSSADIMSLHSHSVLQFSRECLVLTSCPYTLTTCCRSSGNVWCWHHVLTLSLCAAGIQGMSGADIMFLTLSLCAAGIQGMSGADIMSLHSHYVLPVFRECLVLTACSLHSHSVLQVSRECLVLISCSSHSHSVLQVSRECLVLTSCPHTPTLCCRSSGNVWCWHHVLTLSLCAAGIQGTSGADIMFLTLSLCAAGLQGMSGADIMFLTLSLCAAGLQGMSGADSMFLHSHSVLQVSRECPAPTCTARLQAAVPTRSCRSWGLRCTRRRCSSRAILTTWWWRRTAATSATRACRRRARRYTPAWKRWATPAYRTSTLDKAAAAAAGAYLRVERAARVRRISRRTSALGGIT